MWKGHKLARDEEAQTRVEPPFCDWVTFLVELLTLAPLSSQGRDQAGFRTAPSGHQIEAPYRRIAARCAAGDVVEVRAIGGGHILLVNSWVEEADV